MINNIIHIVGVHQKLEAYPNVLFLIKELKRTGSFDYKEYNKPMWSGGLSSKKNIFVKIANLLKALLAHLSVYIYFLKSPVIERVYIPYPSMFVAFSIMLLPKNKKPKYIVLDAFISIYDTVIIDRELFSKKGLIARLLKNIEKKSFQQADVVITDTYQNSLYYCKLFNLPIKKFRNIPLSTDEDNFCFRMRTVQRKEAIFNIVFIGTLIPLHGIDTIIEAATLLIKNKKIQFTIIGDGQMSDLIEDGLKNNLRNIKWIRQWQTSKQLAEHLSQANLALGIFGKGDKTQRVCPFKLYAYMACGIPIITGETRWSIQITEKVDYSPLLTVSVGSSQELANAIYQCYQSKIFCTELAINSRRYYDNKLANRNVIQQFEKVFIS